MSELKYKVGDRVRIKSIDWYNENKDEVGNIVFSSKVPQFSWNVNVRTMFTKDMVKFCGKVVTIESVWTVNYSIVEGTYRYYFTDEMIEGIVKEEIKNWADVSIPDGPFTVTYGSPSMNDSMNKNNIDNGIIILPEGYIFKDENGNEILTSKIILEKKKKEYPKTYEECCDVLSIQSYYKLRYYTYEHGYNEYATSNQLCLLQDKLNILGKLIICRNAYWKLYGDEIGLGKPWEPDWTNEEWPDVAYISYDGKSIDKENGFPCCNMILIFPTEEMRDAFKENFDPDIEFCKELL